MSRQLPSTWSSKPDLRVRQGEGGHRLVGRASLAGDGAEEFSARGGVEEEARTATVVPRWRTPSATRSSRPPVTLSSVAGAVTFGGGERETGDGGDGGERFAPEAEGADADEIGHAPHLAGRVAIEREHGVFPAHAGAVVAHQHQGLATLLQLHAHVPGARIERVLHQLLHHGSGALDHLARGDLVGDGVRQDGDTAGHRENLAADGGHRLVREPSTLRARRLHHDPAR